MNYLNPERPFRDKLTAIFDWVADRAEESGDLAIAEGIRAERRWLEAEGFCARHGLQLRDLAEPEVEMMFRIECPA